MQVQPFNDIMILPKGEKVPLTLTEYINKKVNEAVERKFKEER